MSASACATREDVVRVARGLMGTKWAHQGRTATGIDCGGLILYVGWELGLIPKTYDLQGYRREPDGYSLQRAVFTHLREKPWSEWQAGDVPLLTEVDHRWPLHLGVLADRDGLPYMIHSWARYPFRKVVETRFDEGWRKCLSGLYTFRLLED